MSTPSNTSMRDDMAKNTARYPRRAPRTTGNETPTDRFEFARRHIIQRDKLLATQKEAFNDLYAWLRSGRASHENDRRPRNPEERQELKELTNAYRDIRARLLMHDNDGRLI